VSMPVSARETFKRRSSPNPDDMMGVGWAVGFWPARQKTSSGNPQIKNVSESSKEVIERLIGAWTLVSWFESKPNGEVTYPLGEDAIGQIMYTADGYVAAQLARRTREQFHSEDWREASDMESARAWKEYFGYFGTFSVDLHRGAVVHHVNGAWFPNLLGSDQVRYFQLQGTQLILDADTEWGHVRIVWERAKPALHDSD
jgi:hypothetical protein